MPKQDYIPLFITFFLEITNGSKLCLPIQLEPIGFRLTWEMICAAKKDEKEMALDNCHFLLPKNYCKDIP
jgi:hypothetical protein